MPAFYVTATGTDIGKTYAAASLLRAARARKIRVMATKPVMTGFAETELEQSDCGRLLSAMGEPCTPAAVSAMCHTRLAPPLAPNVAMRLAGVEQDYDGILGFVRRRLDAESDLHLVEGAGGVMSPVTDDRLQIDLMADLGLPVILVTAAYLGSVSHTLTAIDALQGRGLAIARVIISQPGPEGGDDREFAREITRFRPVCCQRLGHGAAMPEDEV